MTAIVAALRCSNTFQLSYAPLSATALQLLQQSSSTEEEGTNADSLKSEEERTKPSQSHSALLVPLSMDDEVAMLYHILSSQTFASR